MALPPLLIQTAGSLVAILALAGLARWMQLGGTSGLSDETVLRRAASEVADGFEVARFAMGQDNTAALASDPEGRIMLVRIHGNRPVGRILGPAAKASANGTELTVDCGERRFGVTRLTLADPAPWADAINQLSKPCDA
jgi:hypothetical protein